MEKGKVVVMRRGRRVHFTGFRYLLNFFLVSEFRPIFERRNKISSENLMQSEIRLHKSKFVVSSLFCRAEEQTNQLSSLFLHFHVFFTFEITQRCLRVAIASTSSPQVLFGSFTHSEFHFVCLVILSLTTDCNLMSFFRHN
jgi:hypothetical protein